MPVLRMVPDYYYWKTRFGYYGEVVAVVVVAAAAAVHIAVASLQD